MAKKPETKPMSGKQAKLLWEYLAGDSRYENDKQNDSKLGAGICMTQEWDSLPLLQDYQDEKPENIEAAADFLEIWASALRGSVAEARAKREEKKKQAAKRKAKQQAMRDAYNEDDDD